MARHASSRDQMDFDDLRRRRNAKDFGRNARAPAAPARTELRDRSPEQTGAGKIVELRPAPPKTVGPEVTEPKGQRLELPTYDDGLDDKPGDMYRRR